MLFLLSPAKSLDFVSPVSGEVAAHATSPVFREDCLQLVNVLRTKGAGELSELMNLSPALGSLNAQRYADWEFGNEDAVSRPAVLAFDGDVYDGLQAKSAQAELLLWLQQHIVVLSGLYGALRPLDRIQPYRLEMGTALATARGRNLYAFWGDRVAQYLNWRQRDESDPVVVNLASQEYSKVALHSSLHARVVECVFEDWKAGRFKVISFFAKRARGAMARWAAERNAQTPQELQAFDTYGYSYDADASTPTRLVFRRRGAE